MKPTVILLAAMFLLPAACSSTGEERGIADKRSDFGKFLPMKGDPTHDGLKPVRPFFRTVNRAEILRAIEHACVGQNGKRKEGSSVFDETKGTGYYVNCNPQNRQLLNGYVPTSNSRLPHSR